MRSARRCSKEYYKGPTRRREVIDADGWFHTGDAGFFDDDGQLQDHRPRQGRRASSRDGALFAPNYIENKLKFFPYIKEAVAFGDERDASARFINIDLDAVGNWAERRGIAYSGYTDLAGKRRGLRADPAMRRAGERRPRRGRAAGAVRRSSAS